MGDMYKNQSDVRESVEALLDEDAALSKQLDGMRQSVLNMEKRSIRDAALEVNGVLVMQAVVKPALGGHLKDLAFQLRADSEQDMVAVLAAEVDGKAQLSVIASQALAEAVRW